MLNGVVPAEKSRIGDHDRDGVFDLMVKFDRRHTAALLEPGDAVEIAVTGLVEGLRFGGVDAIRVISRGKGAGKGKGRSGRGRPDFTDFGPRETTVGSFSIYFYHLNHLGTPRTMTDENGNVVWKADYKPFGEAEVAGDAKNRFRFPGQYWAGETGLHYNWHRYYDPGMGRYLTGDPTGLDGGINVYAYANSNSINFIDFYGLDACDIIPGINKALIEGAKGGWYSLLQAINFLSPDAYGPAASISWINPITGDKGGGHVFGLNKMFFVDEQQWFDYGYDSLDFKSTGMGIDVGIAAEGVYAWGSGKWSGEFKSINSSMGPVAGSIFWSPDFSWFGISIGLNLSPIPAGLAGENTYYFILQDKEAFGN